MPRSAAANTGAQPNRGSPNQLRLPGDYGKTSITENQILADGGYFHLLALGHEDDELGLQGFTDVLQYRRHDGSHVGGGGQIAGQIVQAFGLHLPFPHGLRLLTGLGHQSADDHANNKESEKGEDIFGILDFESPSGGGEEKIIGQNTEGCGQYRRSQTKAEGGNHHRQQIDNDHIGRRQHRLEQACQQGRPGHHGHTRQAIKPGQRWFSREYPPHKINRDAADTDDMDVNRPAEADNLIDDRRPEKLAPPGF